MPNNEDSSRKKLRRKNISQKNRAILQQEIDSVCPFCTSKDVGHFHVHHIDQDKTNNIIANLLMLCPLCHSKITKGDILLEDVISRKERLSKKNIDFDIFTNVEIESEFPGGNVAWKNYLAETFNYPKDCQRKKIEGTVMVLFVVDAYGRTTEVTAISGPVVLRQEAIRVITQSPRWIPANQNGTMVKSYKKQPITFRLSTGNYSPFLKT